MSDTDTATEVVAEVAEEVAEQATHVAQTSRGFSGLGLVFGGFVVGAGLGAALGYIFCKRQLESKYYQQAADEIAKMRQHYYNEKLALDSANKGDLESIVRERGYVSAEPPMAVTPPTAVVEAAEEENTDPIVRPPTPEGEHEPEVQNAFEQFGDDAKAPDEWDWHKERSRRSPLRPYVIHVDERDETDAYECVTYTYFEDDDVLCNEEDEIIDEEDRERIVGEKNLERFGHGSDDPEIVYIRNDQLSMDIEINRSPNSYAEEVHGFEPEIRHSDFRRGKLAFDDE